MQTTQANPQSLPIKTVLFCVTWLKDKNLKLSAPKLSAKTKFNARILGIVLATMLTFLIKRLTWACGISS